MYCVDYQMSYPLLVVPYAPRKQIINQSKALKFKDFRAFSFSPLRQKAAVLGSSHVAYPWDFLKAVFVPTN